MKTLEEVDESYEGKSPSGSWRAGYTTYEEPADSLLADGVLDLITRTIPRADSNLPLLDYEVEKNRWSLRRQLKDEPLLFTVHTCWSGYSEYTITNQWAEITVRWGSHERHFESMGEFFKALSEADGSGKGDRW